MKMQALGVIIMLAVDPVIAGDKLPVTVSAGLTRGNVVVAQVHGSAGPARVASSADDRAVRIGVLMVAALWTARSGGNRGAAAMSMQRFSAGQN
jgi:hypothetical protein